MNNLVYLLSLTVSGVKNIKEAVRLDFYKKTIDKDFDADKYRIKAIYGENGAGKSAIITSLKMFQDLFLNHYYLNESKNQSFLDEIINKKTKIFSFNCEYIVTVGELRNVYNYTIKLGKNNADQYEIKYEKLMKKNGNYPNNNYKTIYECKDGKITSIELDGKEKEDVVGNTSNLLLTHPFIALYVANLKKEEFARDIENIRDDFRFDIILCLTLAVILDVYLEEDDRHELYFLKKKLREIGIDKQLIGEDVYGFLSVNEKRIEKKNYDRYEKKIEQLTSFIKIFKSDLVSIDIESKEDGEFYICETLLNYGDYRVNKEFESTGIKKLIRLFDCFYAASNNGIVFIDEMDSNLNDVYLCKLLEYFMYYGSGQLCFTTHNLDPMTVLKENKNSIDFLSSDNHLVQWVNRGNYSPDNCYRNGMIEDLPFNIDATDFIGIFGE